MTEVQTLRKKLFYNKTRKFNTANAKARHWTWFWISSVSTSVYPNQHVLPIATCLMSVHYWQHMWLV